MSKFKKITVISTTLLFLSTVSIISLVDQKPKTSIYLSESSKNITITPRDDLRVLTQNLFIGIDFMALLRFKDVSLTEAFSVIKERAQNMYKELLENDFEARADGMVKQVAHDLPDVICLQEVTIIRNRKNGIFWPWWNFSENIIYDQLETYKKALRKKNLNYKVAIIQENTDVESPAGSFGYVRITDRDVILVKNTIAVENAWGKHFKDQWKKSFVIKTLTTWRGYTTVLINKGGQRYSVVNVHLEPLGTVNEKQTEELIDDFQRPSVPTIIAGDFNFNLDSSSPLKTLKASSFSDAWTENQSSAKNTCCFKKPLSSPSKLSKRIDGLWVTTRLKPVQVKVIGNLSNSRVLSGVSKQPIWLSDHAGVFAHFKLSNQNK